MDDENKLSSSFQHKKELECIMHQAKHYDHLPIINTVHCRKPIRLSRWLMAHVVRLYSRAAVATKVFFVVRLNNAM